MSINSIEDYELSYNLFLTEQEMFRDLSGLSIEAVTESTSLVAIQEGVKETVMNYLQKIMTQIQKIWSKFKAAFSEKVSNFLEKQCKPTLEKAKNASFTVNNYVQYDLTKMQGIDIKPFKYDDQTKDQLQSESEYLKATYPTIAGDGNIKTGLAKLVAKKVDKLEVNQDILQEMFNYCKTDYKKDVDAIAKEIDDLNNSSKTITSMVSTVTAAQEAYNTLAGFGLFVLNEADEDDPTKGEKQTFTDNSGETSGDSKENDKAKGQITTAVTVYMSASTKLLSAKMSMVNGKFKSYINILNHLVVSYAKNKTAVVVDKVKKTPTSAPQADIKK